MVTRSMSVRSTRVPANASAASRAYAMATAGYAAHLRAAVTEVVAALR